MQARRSSLANGYAKKLVAKKKTNFTRVASSNGILRPRNMKGKTRVGEVEPAGKDRMTAKVQGCSTGSKIFIYACFNGRL